HRLTPSVLAGRSILPLVGGTRSIIPGGRRRAARVAARTRQYTSVGACHQPRGRTVLTRRVALPAPRRHRLTPRPGRQQIRQCPHLLHHPGRRRPVGARLSQHPLDSGCGVPSSQLLSHSRHIAREDPQLRGAPLTHPLQQPSGLLHAPWSASVGLIPRRAPIITGMMMFSLLFFSVLLFLLRGTLSVLR